MTAPYRTAIREAFRTTLAGKTAAGQAVFTALDRPLNPDKDLPAILVYVTTANRADDDYGNMLIPRDVTVIVEAAISATAATALADAESLAEQIEVAIEADPSLGGVVHNVRWLRSNVDQTAKGQTTIGVCLLEYEARVMTMPRTIAVMDGDFDGPVPSKVFSDPAVRPPGGDPVYGDSLCRECGCDLPQWGGEAGQ